MWNSQTWLSSSWSFSLSSPLTIFTVPLFPCSPPPVELEVPVPPVVPVDVPVLPEVPVPPVVVVVVEVLVPVLVLPAVVVDVPVEVLVDCWQLCSPPFTPAMSRVP
ncbi:MAG: hypothetical protein E6I28_10940 [Chloroflexi bacterium]|nr:MAG: hypothetical protein E6I28_10940 [Chloroflexota bacterium]